MDSWGRLACYPRGTFGAPPLQFRRRPPQSNYPPGAVPDPDHGPRLELQHTQGGISTLAPHWLAPMLPSLPPILHNAGQNSTSSYSKGPRGLSVLPQLTSIFTRTSISPGLWLRQWGSRYAIRAGRNSTAKQFAYLRTVLLTAATHLRLASQLRSEELTVPRDLQALRRRHSVSSA